MEKISGHIRFGVICGNADLHSWQKTTLERLILQPDIDLKLVIFERNQLPGEHNATSSNRVWKYYYRNRVQKKSEALQYKKSDGLFKGVLKIHCELTKSENGQQVSLLGESIKKIEELDLDFIINFSAKRVAEKVFDVPKYGVWTYEFGDLEKYKNGTPCFWEIYHQNAVTSAYLTRFTDAPSTAKILHQGHLKTSISHRKNLDKMLRECATWPLKICVAIRNSSSEFLEVDSEAKEKQIRSPPSQWQLLLFPIIQFKLLLKQGWKQLFYTDYWNIGIVLSPIQEFLDIEKKHAVNWFPDLAKNRFMADPFGLYFKDQLHIVYEDLKFEEGIGKTASFLFDNGVYYQNKIVIDEEFHMSYPFLLEREGEIYCVPETYQANQVRLYKAIDFPTKWTLEKVIIDDYAGIDSTLFEHKGRWFLFSTDKNSGPHYNLNIHYADTIFGPWKAHPKNPVKTDIRSARPAGTLFEYNNELFRPSMDYSEKIEGRITINKVRTLSINDFNEEVHNMVRPFEKTYFSDKVHTLSKIGPYTLVDGAKELFIFSNFNAFKYKMKRVLNKVKNK